MDFFLDNLILQMQTSALKKALTLSKVKLLWQSNGVSRRAKTLILGRLGDGLVARTRKRQSHGGAWGCRASALSMRSQSLCPGYKWPAPSGAASISTCLQNFRSSRSPFQSQIPPIKPQASGLVLYHSHWQAFSFLVFMFPVYLHSKSAAKIFGFFQTSMTSNVPCLHWTMIAILYGTTHDTRWRHLPAPSVWATNPPLGLHHTQRRGQRKTRWKSWHLPQKVRNNTVSNELSWSGTSLCSGPKTSQPAPSAIYRPHVRQRPPQPSWSLTSGEFSVSSPPCGGVNKPPLSRVEQLTRDLFTLRSQEEASYSGYNSTSSSPPHPIRSSSPKSGPADGDNSPNRHGYIVKDGRMRTVLNYCMVKIYVYFPVVALGKTTPENLRINSITRVLFITFLACTGRDHRYPTRNLNLMRWHPLEATSRHPQSGPQTTHTAYSTLEIVFSSEIIFSLCCKSSTRFIPHLVEGELNLTHCK